MLPYSGGIATPLAYRLHLERLESLISVMVAKNALQTNYCRVTSMWNPLIETVSESL